MTAVANEHGSRPENYPALGFDPAPGTVGKVEAVAEDFSRIASQLGEAHTALTQIGRNGGIWQGEAAEKFQAKIGELPGYLDKANRSMGDAAKVLAQWSSDLSSMQATAARYEAQAQDATQHLDRAKSNPDLGLAGKTFDDPDSLRQAESRYEAAAAQLSAAEHELTDIRDMATRLLAQHEDLASQVAKALKNAKDEAPPEPDLFDKIGEAFDKFGKGVKDLANKTWKWVKDHANTINKVGDVLSTVGTVLSIATVACAAIPVVGEVVGAAALAVNGAALAAHGLAKAAGAKVGWSTLAFDAVGMIPGGGAVKGELGALKAAPRLIRAVTRGAKGAEGLGEAVGKGAEAGGKVLSRLSRDYGWEPTTNSHPRWALKWLRREHRQVLLLERQ